MATILVCQNSPLGVELYFYAKIVFCLSKLLPAACQGSGNALLKDEAACGFSLDLILSTYGICTVYLDTDSSSEDDEGKMTIQIDGICMFGGMHIWNTSNLENTKLITPKSVI